jgi:hypothetical protein
VLLLPPYRYAGIDLDIPGKLKSSLCGAYLVDDGERIICEGCLILVHSRQIAPRPSYNLEGLPFTQTLLG